MDEPSGDLSLTGLMYASICVLATQCGISESTLSLETTDYQLTN